MFDKTGTLTEEGLSVLGYKPVNAGKSGDKAHFGEFAYAKDIDHISGEKSWWNNANME